MSRKRIRLKVPRNSSHVQVGRGGSGGGSEDLSGIVAVAIVIVMLHLLFSCQGTPPRRFRSARRLALLLG